MLNTGGSVSMVLDLLRDYIGRHGILLNFYPKMKINNYYSLIGRMIEEKRS